VQVLEREDDLSRVETRVRLGEAADLAQVAEHLATGHVLQHHVQVRVVLEVKTQRYEEWKTDSLQYPLLVERMLDLFQLYDLLLIEYLHGIILFSGFVLNDHHATERTGAESLDTFKIVQGGGISRILFPLVLELLFRFIEEFLDALGGVDLLVGGRGIVTHFRCRADARVCQGSFTGSFTGLMPQVIQRAATSSSACVRVRSRR